MKMKKINYLILLVVVFVGISCEPTYKKEYSWAYPVAGDWMVKTYVGGVAQGKPYEIKSYNSAFGKDSVWIDDYGIGVDKAANYGNFWTMKFKVAVNIGDKTFSNGTTNVINAIPDYGIGINILNGKIVGNDSIYFEVKFEDDATPYGTTYQIAGHRETSYEEYMK
jgi:hypothetical protein